MAEVLTSQPDQVGLITANGGYLTKHSMGVHAARPPEREFRWRIVQPEVDAEPKRRGELEWTGSGRVETWTTRYGRDGLPGPARPG
jgi:acetyl-CoA C-acetyltransferase